MSIKKYDSLNKYARKTIFRLFQLSIRRKCLWNLINDLYYTVNSFIAFFLRIMIMKTYFNTWNMQLRALFKKIYEYALDLIVALVISFFVMRKTVYMRALEQFTIIKRISHVKLNLAYNARDPKTTHTINAHFVGIIASYTRRRDRKRERERESYTTFSRREKCLAILNCRMTWNIELTNVYFM